MRILFVALFVLFVYSCQYKVDKTNIFNISEALHQSFIDNDTLLYKKLFISEFNEIRKQDFQNIQKRFIDGLSLIKVDTTHETMFGRDYNTIELFYKKSTSFYRLSSFYSLDSLGEYYLSGIYFFDIKEKCNETANDYRLEELVNFDRINWELDVNLHTFKRGTVRLKNNSNFDLNYIKFRVILKDNTSYGLGETFFNQTIENHTTIYKGDIATIDIPGMNNFFTDFKVEEDNVSFKAVLIDLSPKPESHWCILQRKLENEFQNK